MNIVKSLTHITLGTGAVNLPMRRGRRAAPLKAEAGSSRLCGALGMDTHLSTPPPVLWKWDNNHVSIDPDHFGKAPATEPGS